MKSVLIAVLSITLLLSWLGFLTLLERPFQSQEQETEKGDTDEIVVWLNEMLGTPDEAYYYELQDCWNVTHSNVKMKLAVMSHAGYDSKLRVAIASGQPPDVCTSGFETLQALESSGKSLDLAAPIPEDILPVEQLKAMGPVVERSALRNGKPYVFPLYRYCYGGVMLANRTMLMEAGYDDDEIRRNGWTFDQFRDACKRMTKDLDGDGKTDIWGYASALSHMEHLLLNEFGPAIYGKEIATAQFLGYDEQTKRWTRHPGLTEDHFYQLCLLYHQLINVDKSWNPNYLSMTTYELLDEIITQQKLGMMFGSIPWAPKVYKDIWDLEVKQGVKKPNPFPDLTTFWTPTLRKGDWPSPSAGVYGLSVLKQTPYKGDTHTRNACRVALFLTHPVHLARSQMRFFRHLPPEPERFGKIFPELIDMNDRWVKYYNEVMESGHWHTLGVDSATAPDFTAYQAVNMEVINWLRKTGYGVMEQVIYQKITPEEGGRRLFVGIKEAADKTYEKLGLTPQVTPGASE